MTPFIFVLFWECIYPSARICARYRAFYEVAFCERYPSITFGTFFYSLNVHGERRAPFLRASLSTVGLEGFLASLSLWPWFSASKVPDYVIHVLIKNSQPFKGKHILPPPKRLQRAKVLWKERVGHSVPKGV
jgi:hypothetical protein